MSLEELMKEAIGNGPYAVIAIYLIWQGRKDYAGVCSRLNKVEDYCKNTLHKQLERASTAIERCNGLIDKTLGGN